MTTEPTRPEPARPLTDREKVVLARMAADLRRTPGRPGARSPEVPRPARSGPRTRDVVVQVVVVVVLAVVLMPTVWAGAVLAVIVLSGPVAAAWWARRRGAG
ncbi:hypothetical protein [Actinomycetospora lemnae]|uniref:DUF3040 domain-containing protein n=1 Tax=Actinomycetospora lemnae TaxID=3019891 RepID=A0ABT5SYX4_9PSEU|nr:hypothetical protein [Actinomycetospora sp. DW7H6]MDD7968052.1 hypothetical protein [Actinomycetospora sp. DW7H6]